VANPPTFWQLAMRLDRARWGPHRPDADARKGRQWPRYPYHYLVWVSAESVAWAAYLRLHLARWERQA